MRVVEVDRDLRLAEARAVTRGRQAVDEPYEERPPVARVEHRAERVPVEAPDLGRWEVGWNLCSATCAVSSYSSTGG